MTDREPLNSVGFSPRVQVISRVGQILRTLSLEPGGLSLADVVARTERPKRTAYRLPLALEREELVDALDGPFRIGRALSGVGTSWHEELRRRVRPMMERLAVQAQETVDLDVLVGDRIMFIDQVRWQRELTVGAIVGELYPAYDGQRDVELGTLVRELPIGYYVYEPKWDGLQMHRVPQP